MLALIPCGWITAEDRAGDRFFRERIEPVLREHCYKCHSKRGKAIKGKLRLDSKTYSRRGGETGPAVVPGSVDKSLLIMALRYDGLEMPPSGTLPDATVADFVKWIEMGAPDPRPEDHAEKEADKSLHHWSFQPILDPRPPEIKGSGRIRNDIDRFILRNLDFRQVAQSPEADRVTLLRRLYLDLIGLPPSPAQVSEFLAEDNEEAYEAVVDQLLASPHYGERWGRYWLDMARYADTNGYEADRPRPHAWRWRDWVIDAINSDMPFDEFTIEQLAGDLLPDANLEQLVATGFHRNTLVNTEGGVDREEDRVKRTVDRTNTVGKVWLGLTLQCCQCHSHKYDPISQHEYYSMYSFFNSLTELEIPAPTQEQIHQYEAELESFNVDHEKYLRAISEYRSDAMRHWEQSLSKDGPAWSILTPTSLSSNSRNLELQLEDDLSVFVHGKNDVESIYRFVCKTRVNGITAVRLEVLADDRLPSNGPGLASNGNFVLSSLRVYVKSAGDSNPKFKGRYVPLKTARADYSQGNRQVTSVLGNDPKDGWAVYPEVGKNHVAVFELSKDIRRDKRDAEVLILTIELDHQVHADHNLGRFRLAVTTVPRPIPIGLTDSALSDILQTPVAKRSGQDVLRLVRFLSYREEPLDRLISAEMEHRKQKPKTPESAFKARTTAERDPPRVTHVHVRGNFLVKGDVVQQGTPKVLPPLPPSETSGGRPNRLDLARWLVNDTNPLTARVIVNRVWQQHFGRGLVVTDDDFGTQGEAPSHPELLDWLAFQFRRNGWSLKQLHRLIVTSATWRQASIVRPDLADRDPLNKWLARQNRLRVEAEIIRDLALSVGGLLHPKIGGPSVYPPQPADRVKLGFQKSVSWPVSEGPDRYRRGLYTFFQRTVPYPMLIEFDAADSNTSCTRRERSNTPLQALTLLNDPVFVECAQALGQRIVVAAPDRRIDYLFRICLSRRPTQRERAVLSRLYVTQRKRYESDPRSAAQLIGKTNTVTAEMVADVAASISLARVVMNLDEFITRE
jgi:hypothetical protein